MRQDTQAVDESYAQQRSDHRPGHSQHHQQRPDVGQQNVLCYVGDEQLLAKMCDRRDERRQHDCNPRGEGELACYRHGPASTPERAGPPKVRRQPRERGDQLERLKGAAADVR
jgi:hypothetical protein